MAQTCDAAQQQHSAVALMRDRLPKCRSGNKVERFDGASQPLLALSNCVSRRARLTAQKDHVIRSYLCCCDDEGLDLIRQLGAQVGAFRGQRKEALVDEEGAVVKQRSQLHATGNTLCVALLCHWC